jgi:DNA-directed RNA polymerase specialized sigma24 family protein
VNRISSYENFRTRPIGRAGWKESAKSIAEFFGGLPDDFWPEEARHLKAKEMRFCATAEEMVSPYAAFETAEARQIVAKTIGLLAPSHRAGLKEKFWEEKTMVEIGQARGRVGQTMTTRSKKAIRRLRQRHIAARFGMDTLK